MARKLAGVLIVLVLVVGVAALYAVAAESAAREEAKESKAAEKAEAAPEKAAEAPAPAAERPTMTPEEMIARSEERMKAAGMSEGTLLRNRQMQMARFQVDQPAGLLALKDQLKLTPEQVKKIEGINAAACKDAKAVLTKEQADMIATMDGTPDTMLALSSEMRGRMGGRGGRGGGGN